MAARILRGGCSVPPSQAVWAVTWVVEAGAPEPPELEAGVWGFEVFVVREPCGWIATGCTSVNVPGTTRAVTALGPPVPYVQALCDRDTECDMRTGLCSTFDNTHRGPPLPCNADRKDCNGDGSGSDADGCEVDLTRDKTCGDCDISCSDLPGVDPAATACGDDKRCDIVCQEGRHDCSPDPRDGCETEACALDEDRALEVGCPPAPTCDVTCAVGGEPCNLRCSSPPCHMTCTAGQSCEMACRSGPEAPPPGNRCGGTCTSGPCRLSCEAGGIVTCSGLM